MGFAFPGGVIPSDPGVGQVPVRSPFPTGGGVGGFEEGSVQVGSPPIGFVAHSVGGVEYHALFFEQGPLQVPGWPREFSGGKPAVSVDHSPPGQLGIRAQRVEDPPHTPSGSRLPGHGGYRPVARHFPQRDVGDGFADCFLERGHESRLKKRLLAWLSTSTDPGSFRDLCLSGKE